MPDDMNDSIIFPPSSMFTPQIKGSQKKLLMLFLVDNSGSMRINDGGSQDTRMDAVNKALSRIVPKLQRLEEEADDYELYIAIMTFNQTAEWVTPTPVPISQFTFTPLESSRWVTYYSEAFKVLGEKLTRSAFLSGAKNAWPYIMLITDGEPTSTDQYEDELKKLKENNYFANAQRFSVLIGEEAIHSRAARDAVFSFGDSEESILTATDAEEVANRIQAQTIISILDMTHLAPVGEESKAQNADLIDIINDFME